MYVLRMVRQRFTHFDNVNITLVIHTLITINAYSVIHGGDSIMQRKHNTMQFTRKPLYVNKTL
ncbi:MAG: hypothetical protein RJB36_633 [Bacteroidota bacterium]|jgi:hypothetical protein